MLPLQQGGIAFLIQINMKNKKLQKWDSNPRLAQSDTVTAALTS